MYYEPPYRTLPPVDWSRNPHSVYHNGFNRPLGLWPSLGVGIRDRTTGTTYTLFVHRGFAGPAFSERDAALPARG